ncbi:MAG TPA: type II toxin-antitoxin system RelE/ParE family toxin [Bosea sp. (in: a-proteobacteria)]
MRVVVTEAALDDLMRIGRSIAQDAPARAETFVAELYDRCRRLADMPRAYPLLPNWEEAGVRRRVYGAYLIFYRIAEDAVEVLHIVHGAQDYERILFPDE